MDEDDKNVDINNTINVYKNEFDENLSIKVFYEAQHSLLSTQYFKDTNYDLWHLVKFEFLQEQAFVSGYLDFVTSWIDGQTKK